MKLGFYCGLSWLNMVLIANDLVKIAEGRHRFCSLLQSLEAVTIASSILHADCLKDPANQPYQQVPL